MAITGTSLADGQLPAAKGTLYTSVGITYEKIVALCNVSGSSQTVKLYVNRAVSGVSRRIRTMTLDPDQSYELSIALPMSAGDLLEGESTNATSVDYVIGGGVS